SSKFTTIGNGRLIESIKKGGKTISHWRVVNPINLYDVTFYIGDYVHWSDTLNGEKGVLNLDYYVLRENLDRAKLQFAMVKQMIHCFEFWLGPYPFYEDGYKLVESPYLGMEHQSAVAYGNDYKMGYYGMDRSHTGVGLLFDFIIVHESAHEWFGNSISANDVAYSWIQEGFTTYCESIFTECAFGKEQATKYQLGQWNIISNKSPIEGVVDMCDGGSVDQYEKASSIIHMIRQIINDDEQFRQLLRALNKTFYHKTVDGPTVEKFINDFTKHDFTQVFNQYLRTVQIPRLAFKMVDSTLSYRWDNTIDEFDMPVLIQIDEVQQWLFPTNLWQDTTLNTTLDLKTQVKIDPNFLVRKKIVE
ncbi:MAG: M1 family aminopeptidase, partial [Crocinitomicaceae bacterium]